MIGARAPIDRVKVNDTLIRRLATQRGCIETCKTTMAIL
jgi:hypothetical protein